MRVLSATACTGRSFDEFLDIYQILREPLQLSAIECAVGINFTVDDIPKIKQAGIDTVLWHDAFWFVQGQKMETYPSRIAEYFDLHKLFCAADINVPLWSIHPYKSHRPAAMWTDALYETFCMDYWADLEYVLPKDDDPESSYYYNARDFRIVFENMLPNAPCYNNLESVLQTSRYVRFCIDYSHINIWCHGDREQTIVQCLLATNNAVEIHLSSNKGYRDSHDYIPADEWFMPHLDMIEKSQGRLLYLTYESLPEQYKEYGRLDK